MAEQAFTGSMMKENAIDEYIGKQAILEDFESCNRSDPKWTPQRVKALIVRQSPADAVPVIRCKDCKHWSDSDGIHTTADGTRFARCRIHNIEIPNGQVGWCPKGSDYCSLGERKEKANENRS